MAWQMIIKVAPLIIGKALDVMDNQQERKNQEKMQLMQLESEREQRLQAFKMAQLEIESKEKERQYTLSQAKLTMQGNVNMALIEGSVRLFSASLDNYQSIKQMQNNTEQLRIQADTYIKALQAESNERINKMNNQANENIKVIESVFQAHLATLQSYENMNKLLLESKKANHDSLQTVLQQLATPNLDKDIKDMYKNALNNFMTEQNQIGVKLIENTQNLSQISTFSLSNIQDNLKPINENAIAYTNNLPMLEEKLEEK